MTTAAKESVNWEELADEAILGMRVRDLNLRIAGSPIEPIINRLYEELDARGLRFHPPCYLADEWLCPDKMPIIGVPFCLAHWRLKRIEKKMMLEVEGDTEQSCMKLLRHECGHVYNYAYGLYRKTRWRQLFGCFSARYSDWYYYQPYSRRYVIHLEDNYAQSHPDEDFAETFAVWLTPESNWQQKYAGWPVASKLLYVEGLMRKIGSSQAIDTVKNQPPWAASRMISTLAAHYDRKRRALGSNFKGYYDDILVKLFKSVPGQGYSSVAASRLFRIHRREMVDSVARWTGHRKYDIDQLVARLIERCDALQLRASDANLIGVSVLLAAIASKTLRIQRKGKGR